MKKFIVLYQSTTSAEEQMAKAPPEQAKAGMDMWMQWAKKAGAALVEMGAPLGNAAQVDRGGSTSKGKTQVSGYSILQAASLKDVAKILEGHPHFMMPGNTIEVLEALEMPGM
jgi:hypothetical protein